VCQNHKWQTNCQNGSGRAISAKMAGYCKSCAKRTANMAIENIVPNKNLFFSHFFFLQ
jgi:hypothetical protein